MQKILRIMLILLILSAMSFSVGFAEVSDEFTQKILNLKWIAYSPTQYNPTNENFPAEDTIYTDLQLLYQAGFRGIVTYSSYNTFSEIPRIAREIGFEGVIMGIWDINNQEELINAELANQHVDGYCMGNEGLNCRYDLEELTSAIARLKESTGKPVTTTEQVFDYHNKDVLDIGDWIFPNIHPFLSEIRSPKKAATWIEKHYSILSRHAGTKLIIFKEVGWPTSGTREATASNQKEFFLAFEKKGIPFIYFEAFDQYWKRDLPVEPYWGLFDKNRKAKKFIAPTLI
ncbi:MAG: hypothetical protein NTZ92_04085 [Candidatus Omnitrophica bacterium]|nr:hypothetical protein [Candidatus Omnitrophota bacterium]